jgi:CPA1 family monovalent cation:H+ antiporter
VTGVFSLADAAVEFVTSVAGGVAVGLAVGFVVRQARRRIDNPPAEIAISLVTGYFAYLPAEYLGVSAVLAAVTAGIYMGWHTPELTTPTIRLQSQAMWEITTFMLNALLFVVVGLQLPVILDGLRDIGGAELAMDALAIVGTVIITRLVWVFPATYVPRRLSARMRKGAPTPPWRAVVVIGWAGMRGAVSLAAALALPTSGEIAQRDLLIFLTFAVILGTLVGQGLTLPALIRALRLEDDDVLVAEEIEARIHAAEAALARLQELAPEDWVRDDTAERLRGLYEFRRTRFAAQLDDGDDGAIEERSAAYRRLQQDLLDAQRQAVFDLRRSGRIDDEVMRRVARDLDLESVRLDS